MLPNQWRKQFQIFLMIAICGLFIVFVLNKFAVQFSCSSDAATRSIYFGKEAVFSQVGNVTVKTVTKMPTEPLLASLKHLLIAHRHVKSGKVAIEIGEAIQILQGLLEANSSMTKAELTSSSTAVQVGESEDKVDVCPDTWIAAKHGLPYFLTGYELVNCANAHPLGSVITYVINAVHDLGTRASDLLNILQGLNETYPAVPVIIGLPMEPEQAILDFIKTTGLSVGFHQFSSSKSDASIWRQLLDHVTTKYTFLARHVTHVLPVDTRLERLLQLIVYANADVVGGSYRDGEGRWSIGCYQSVMRNYVYRIIEGYDLSYNSCIYCDYLGGPFAAKTDLLRSYLSSIELDGELVFLDFFSKIRKDSDGAGLIVCPDSMHYTRNLNISVIPRKDWLSFIKSWQINHVILPSSELHRFTCAETDLRCPWDKGLTMPKCCLEELSEMTRLLMRTCDTYDIACELEGGTVIGSIKFNGFLPWERDSDVYWYSMDYYKMLNSTSVYSSSGFSLKEDTAWQPVPIPACMDGKQDVTWEVRCGEFALRSEHWRIQLLGSIYMPSDYLKNHGIQNRTRTLLDGQWVTDVPNPALYARNQYGDDVFAHVEHWISIGLSTGWAVPYKTGTFEKCPRPGFHGCLDRFLPTGNLQFYDNWL